MEYDLVNSSVQGEYLIPLIFYKKNFKQVLIITKSFSKLNFVFLTLFMIGYRPVKYAYNNLK